MARQPKRPQAPRTKSSDGSRGPSRTVVAWLAIAALVALGLIAASVILSRDGDGDATTTTPLTESGLEGIPQSGAVLGDPEANVTLIEYADLACPFCKTYAVEIFPSVVDEYLRPGKMNTEFRGLAFVGPSSEKALRLVYAAGLQDRMWFMVEALYANQGDETTDWLTDNLARDLARGIAGLDVDRLFENADSAEVTAAIEESQQQADDADVKGTPWFVIQVGDGEPYHIAPRTVEEFRAALDEAIAQ